MKVFAKAELVRGTDISSFLDSTVSPAVRKSVEAACSLIEASAKQYCPVETGVLRDSITSVVDQQGLQQITGYVGPTVDYATYVEFGTGRRGDPSAPYPHTDKPGMVAHPFMRPAIDENKDAVESLFRETLAIDLEVR